MFFVPVESSASIAEKLELLIKDTELRKQFAEYSQQHYLAHFTVKKMVENLSLVFKKVIERKISFNDNCMLRFYQFINGTKVMKFCRCNKEQIVFR